MNIAIIPAAGSGSRFGGQTPKQFLEIAGAPIIIHTLRRFDSCEDIGAIIVALQASEISSFEECLSGFEFRKPVRLVPGGAERSDSILNALEAAREFDPELVAVHDAVRPFVTPAQISAVLARAGEAGAAILALPATDTIKEVEGGIIRRTIDRRLIWRAQTPQAFRYEMLLRANAEARTAGLPPALTTDDSLLVENLGLEVAVVEGSAHNIKITTPEDFILAERLFEEMSQESPQSTNANPAFRTGIGNDIHRLVEGRKLILGGIEIPFEKGLLGHSDGDSLSHAITDALLGAAGLGDIGTHFSDRDPRWAGADSRVFLRHVRSLIVERGYQIYSIDATILAEKPKMMPHVEAMRASLAGTLEIDPSQINIKAKTNEGLDAIGRGEAIAALASALISRI
ncbi:MAG: 2-C-methyl-D-erythritol 4-phosphate cytidylyltransferase [Acidobacteria bacterium]|nr:2-C-methyl-D-erythritol 4-phosphate cytidylyltransferase [Acidobacteriota bacterium]